MVGYFKIAKYILFTLCSLYSGKWNLFVFPTNQAYKLLLHCQSQAKGLWKHNKLDAFYTISTAACTCNQSQPLQIVLLGRPNGWRFGRRFDFSNR